MQILYISTLIQNIQESLLFDNSFGTFQHANLRRTSTGNLNEKTHPQRVPRSKQKTHQVYCPISKTPFVHIQETWRQKCKGRSTQPAAGARRQKQTQPGYCHAGGWQTITSIAQKNTVERESTFNANLKLDTCH